MSTEPPIPQESWDVIRLAAQAAVLVAFEPWYPLMVNTTEHGALARSAALPLAQREAIVRRFNERVTGALLHSPPTKELVKRALRRKGAPRCLVRVQRLSLDVILRYGDDLADVFCAYPDDIISPHPYDFFVGYQKPHAKDPVNAIQVLTEPATWTDEWGTQWGHAEGGVGATSTGYPLTDWSQLDDYLAHQEHQGHCGAGEEVWEL